MTTEEAGETAYRPALSVLTADVRELQTDLLTGLDSRRALLMWLQQATVRCLGELPPWMLRQFSRQFRPRQDGSDSLLLAALLADDVRAGPPDEATARDTRERFLARLIDPAFRQAFRTLRNDATEYATEADELDAHNPDAQRFPSMRPALAELEEHQQATLERLLAPTGLDDGADVLDWSKLLVLATHGEVEPEAGLAARVYEERSTRRLLTDPSPAGQRGRELFAARHLLPRFAAGVRDLSGRAGELPDAERETSEVEFA